MVPVHSGAAAAPAATSPSTANTANTRTNWWAIAFSPAGVGTGGESLVLRVRAVKVEPHPAVAGRDPRRPTWAGRNACSRERTDCAAMPGATGDRRTSGRTAPRSAGTGSSPSDSRPGRTRSSTRTRRGRSRCPRPPRGRGRRRPWQGGSPRTRSRTPSSRAGNGATPPSRGRPPAAPLLLSWHAAVVAGGGSLVLGPRGGQGRASHQNPGYRAGGRTSEVTVTHSEPREEPVTRPSLREYAAVQRERYLAATRAEKGLLLDEVVAVTGLHRKAAIRLLRRSPRAPTARARAGRPRIYGWAVAHAA